MSKHLPRVAAILFAAIMLLSLNGCSTAPAATSTPTASSALSVTTTTAPAASASEPVQQSPKPVTFTWLSVLAAKDITTGIQDNDVFNELAKRTGVTLDFSPNLNVSDVNEKCTLLIASGDVPDLITTGYADNIKKIIKAGVAVALDDLVKKNAPNMMKNVIKALAVSKLLRSDETHNLYFIPDNTSIGGAPSPIYPGSWYVRWDLYKQLGSPKINTYDDFLKLIIDMQKLEPTTKDGKKTYAMGIALKDQYSHCQVQFPSTIANGLYFATWESDVDIKTNTMVKRWTDDPKNVTLRELRFINQLNRAGLLDPDSVAMSGDILSDKARVGTYLINSSNTADVAFVNAGTPQKGFAPIRLSGEESTEEMDLCDTYQGGGWYSTCITTKCKDPVRAIQFIDYLCTPEGIVLQKYGLEGKQWEIKDGKGVIKDEVLNGIKTDPDYSKKIGMSYYGVTGGLQFMSPIGFQIKGVDANFESNPDIVQKQMTEVQKDFCKTNGFNVPLDLFKDVKQVIYDPWACNIMTLPDDLAKKENALIQYMDKTIPKLIYAKSDEEFNSLYSTLLTDIKSIGDVECDNYHRQDFANSQKGLEDMMNQLQQ